MRAVLSAIFSSIVGVGSAAPPVVTASGVVGATSDSVATSSATAAGKANSLSGGYEDSSSILRIRNGCSSCSGKAYICSPLEKRDSASMRDSITSPNSCNLPIKSCSGCSTRGAVRASGVTGVTRVSGAFGLIKSVISLASSASLSA